MYTPLGISKTRTFTRLKIHSANETSAILSLVRPIHVNGCTCASDPPLGRDTVGKELNVFGKLGALPSYLSACSASLAWYTRFSLSAMVRGYWDLSLRPA